MYIYFFFLFFFCVVGVKEISELANILYSSYCFNILLIFYWVGLGSQLCSSIKAPVWINQNYKLKIVDLFFFFFFLKIYSKTGVFLFH
jgi:hypothetical protein